MDGKLLGIGVGQSGVAVVEDDHQIAVRQHFWIRSLVEIAGARMGYGAERQVAAADRGGRGPGAAVIGRHGAIYWGGDAVDNSPRRVHVVPVGTARIGVRGDERLVVGYGWVVVFDYDVVPARCGDGEEKRA